jgi:hypothetical protein
VALKQFYKRCRRTMQAFGNGLFPDHSLPFDPLHHDAKKLFSLAQVIVHIEALKAKTFVDDSRQVSGDGRYAVVVVAGNHSATHDSTESPHVVNCSFEMMPADIIKVDVNPLREVLRQAFRKAAGVMIVERNVDACIRLEPFNIRRGLQYSPRRNSF